MSIVRSLYSSYMKIPAGVRGPLQRIARLAAVAFATYLIAHGLTADPNTWVPAMGLTPAAFEAAWRKILAAPETAQLIAEEKAKWDAWLIGQAKATVTADVPGFKAGLAAAKAQMPNPPAGS